MQYNPSFVGHRPILTDEDKLWLHGFASKFPLDRFKGDARSYEETIVDFVYTSAKIEGNTYDRIDTDNLLRLGVTAGGKRYSDAIMLVNLRDGFGEIMATEATTELNLGGFKPEVQHLQPSKVRRCHHLVRPRPINNFSLKSASPLPV